MLVSIHPAASCGEVIESGHAVVGGEKVPGGGGRGIEPRARTLAIPPDGRDGTRRVVHR